MTNRSTSAGALSAGVQLTGSGVGVAATVVFDAGAIVALVPLSSSSPIDPRGVV